MKKTFEETYPLYPFSALVALAIGIAEIFVRRRERRRTPVGTPLASH